MSCHAFQMLVLVSAFQLSGVSYFSISSLQKKVAIFLRALSSQSVEYRFHTTWHSDLIITSKLIVMGRKVSQAAREPRKGPQPSGKFRYRCNEPLEGQLPSLGG